MEADKVSYNFKTNWTIRHSPTLRAVKCTNTRYRLSRSHIENLSGRFFEDNLLCVVIRQENLGAITSIHWVVRYAILFRYKARKDWFARHVNPWASERRPSLHDWPHLIESASAYVSDDDDANAVEEPYGLSDTDLWVARYCACAMRDRETQIKGRSVASLPNLLRVLIFYRRRLRVTMESSAADELLNLVSFKGAFSALIPFTAMIGDRRFNWWFIELDWVSPSEGQFPAVVFGACGACFVLVLFNIKTKMVTEELIG